MAEEKNYIVRGIVLGASAGIILSFTGYVDLGRAAALGMIGGFVAGLTLAKKRQGKK